VGLDAVPGEAVGDNPYWRITIYCCKNDPGGAYCGTAASGTQVAPGVAACSPHWDFWTRFQIHGGLSYLHDVVCLDRGSAVKAANHLDIWFYDCGDLEAEDGPAPGTGWHWLQEVGTQAVVEVVGEQD